MKMAPARFAAVAVAVGLVVLIASGCGGRKPAAASETSASDPWAGFVRCARQHGVPDLPDARNGRMVLGHSNGKTTVNGIPLNESSQQIEAAKRACRSLMPAQRDTTPRMSVAEVAHLKQMAMAAAQCVRQHGFPSFPDPKVSSGGVGFQITASERNSPTFNATLTECHMGVIKQTMRSYTVQGH